MINFSFSFGEYSVDSWYFQVFLLGYDTDLDLSASGLDIANFIAFCGDHTYDSSLLRIMRFDGEWSIDILYVSFISEWLLACAIKRYNLTQYSGWRQVFYVALWPIRRFFCKDKRNPLLSWYYNGKEDTDK